MDYKRADVDFHGLAADAEMNGGKEDGVSTITSYFWLYPSYIRAFGSKIPEVTRFLEHCPVIWMEHPYILEFPFREFIGGFERIVNVENDPSKLSPLEMAVDQLC